jgi:hypothetical protein
VLAAPSLLNIAIDGADQVALICPASECAGAPDRAGRAPVARGEQVEIRELQ